MASFRVRRATAHDAEELFRIHRASMTTYLEEAFDGWTEDLARRNHQEWMAGGRGEVILVEGRVVGSLEVGVRGGDLWIERIEIDPLFQGGGIGTAIVEQVQKRAAAGSMRVVLDVFERNPARRLYERLGFHAVTRHGPSIRMEWDPRRDDSTTFRGR